MAIVKHSKHNQSVLDIFKKLLSGNYLSSASRTYSERTSFVLGAAHFAISSFKSARLFDDSVSLAYAELEQLHSDYLKHLSYDDYVQNPYDAELRDCQDVSL